MLRRRRRPPPRRRSGRQPKETVKPQTRITAVWVLFCLGVLAISGLVINEYYGKYVENPSIFSWPVPTSPTESTLELEIEALIFEYTNVERRNLGLKELIWDEKLAEIAREHSKDMADSDFFSHINQKGEDPTDRAKRHGYSLHKELGEGWYSEGIGENIGSMTTGNVLGIGYVSNNADSIAKAHVESWMDSSGHRENILKPSYDRLGVGVVYDGTWYISTQNFW